jgi:uncharacterized protein (DUF1330 family)
VNGGSYPSPAACPCCGGALHKLGEDVTETLELIPRQWKVIQHVREKFSCVPLVQAAQRAAGGRPLNTAGGKIVAIEGAPAPKRVAITEWDSLEQYQAYSNSAAVKNLAPQRDKAVKTIRAYAVEAVN